MWDKLKVQLREQVWDNEQVLKLRQKFSELDSQTQSYVVIGSFAGFVFLLFITFISFWVSATAQKMSLTELEENIRFVQSSAAKIEELKVQARSQGSDSLTRDLDPSAPVDIFLQKVVEKAMIQKAAIELGEPKGPMVDLSLTRISLRQFVRVLYMIENSQAGATIEKFTLDNKDDPEGYISATLSVRKNAKAGGI
jgi:hypothetical protein